MKFSIVIPVYKTEAYLRQCVESVLRQTYGDFEVILVDDGSPDGCPRLCDELQKQDGRVKVIHQTNSGPGIARNAGIDAARGEYLIFLDSDDYWLKDSLLETVSRSLHDGELAVFDLQRLTDGVLKKPDHDCFRAFEDGYAAGEDFLRAVLEARPAFCWYLFMYVFRRSLFSDKELRFSDLKWCEDVALLYRVILRSQQVRIIKESFYAYRQDRGDSASRSVTYETLHGVLSVAEREICRVQAMPGLSERAKALLCGNLTIEYHIVLTLSSRLPKPERKTLLDELARLRWIIQYGRGKEKAKGLLIRLLGVNAAAKLLEWKQIIQGRENQ